MKTFRIASVTSALAAASVIGLVGASPASAATSMSATVYGATVRGSVYSGYTGGQKAVTFSAVVNDTRRTNGYPAKLHVRGQVIEDGSTQVRPAFTGYAEFRTTTSERASLGILGGGKVRKARLKYRVCSRTCSTWRTTPWRSI